MNASNNKTFLSRIKEKIGNDYQSLSWHVNRLVSMTRVGVHGALTRNKIKGRVLVVIDMHDHTRGGHFGTWLRIFAEEFSPFYDAVVVMTPKPWLAMQVFVGPESRLRDNVYIRPLPEAVLQRFNLKALQQDTELRNASELSVFVMWGNDLHRFLPCEYSLPWSAVITCSYMTRAPDHVMANAEEELVRKCRSSKGFAGFLQPDYFLDGIDASAVYLPDIQPVACERRLGGLAKAAAKHKGRSICIGFLGMLTGYRGLNELLLVAKCHPSIRFLLAGKLVRESVDPELRPLLDRCNQSNLFVYPSFVSDDRVLNSLIKITDAVFIDGRNYPVHSGISCRALHFGRGIVTTNSNSWAADVVRTFGAGIAYENPEDEITAALLRWIESGGPSRAKEAALVLRSQSCNRNGFPEIVRRLSAKRVKLSECAKPSGQVL